MEAKYNVCVIDDSRSDQCDAPICLLAFTRSYSVDGETRELGKKDSVAAMISFKSDSDFNVRAAKGLELPFLSMYEHLAERLNPFENKSDRSNLRKGSNTQKIADDIELDDTEATRSRFEKQTEIDDDGTVKSLHEQYNIDLKTERDEEDDGNESDDMFVGQVNFDVDLI